MDYIITVSGDKSRFAPRTGFGKRRRSRGEKKRIGMSPLSGNSRMLARIRVYFLQMICPFVTECQLSG